MEQMVHLHTKLALNKNVQQKTPFDMTVSPEVRKILQQFAPDLGGYNSRT